MSIYLINKQGFIILDIGIIDSIKLNMGKTDININFVVLRGVLFNG